MKNTKYKCFLGLAAMLAVASVPGFGQDPAQTPPPPPPPPDSSSQPAQQAPPNGGWRRFGDPNPSAGTSYDQNGPINGQYAQGQYNPGQYSQNPPYPSQPNQPYAGGPYNGAQPQGAQQQPPPMPPVPASLTLPAGSWITVRVNQPLSSERNQVGDAFTATLSQPLVANGYVIAQRGQTLQGRVAEVQKAGRVAGVSRLGLELNQLGTVDGQIFPIKTTLIERRGNTSVGRDVGAVGVTTGTGAAIGAAAAGGLGAGLGAIAGAGAATIGVLVTRGRPTVVYPETLLTFRLEQPVTVSTEHSPMAFEPVGRYDYQTSYRGGPGPYGPGAGYGGGPYAGAPYGGAPYGGGAPYAGAPAYYTPAPAVVAPYPYYGYPYYPYYWGPSLYFGLGHGFYGRGFYGRGFYRR